MFKRSDPDPNWGKLQDPDPNTHILTYINMYYTESTGTFSLFTLRVSCRLFDTYKLEMGYRRLPEERVKVHRIVQYMYSIGMYCTVHVHCTVYVLYYRLGEGTGLPLGILIPLHCP